MIGIINLNTGNIGSLFSAFDKINTSYIVCKKPEDLDRVSKIVLPGVSAFKDFYDKITQSKFDKILQEKFSKNYPILGICSGFQVLFSESSEHGFSQGLKFLKGKFIAFNETNVDTQIPHVGWTSCKKVKSSKIFNGIKDNSDFYFTHSFFLNDEIDEIKATTSIYDENVFTSSININNLFGVQFHPEKSQLNGLKILKNFSEL